MTHQIHDRLGGYVMGPITRTQDRISIGAGKPRHTALESFNHDGVEIARRKTKRREWPIRHLFLFLVAVLSFKIFLFFDMGGAAYGAKIEELSQGAMWEQVAARAMVLDPASKWFVDGLRYGRW